MASGLATKPATRSFDLQQVKQAAIGHWPTIVQRVVGIYGDYLSGNHGTCPKHGGTDKWRVFPDFEITGGAVCNECGKMADGFELIQRHANCSFPEALEKVADCLGLEPTQSTRLSTPREAIEPDKHLEFLDKLPPAMVAIFCHKKKPITLDGLQSVGTRYATYRGQHPVFALPAMKQGKAVGWAIYHATGGLLPIWEKGNKIPVDHVKIKNTTGSQAGWITTTITESTHTIFKVEGPSDLLALASLGLPDGYAAVTNIFGAGEDPASNAWMLDIFRNRTVYVIHDCDEPGQSGATTVINGNRSRPGWAPAAASVAKQARNVVLPYPIETTHGKDLRDWINDRINSSGCDNLEVFQQLLTLCRQSEQVAGVAIQEKGKISLRLEDHEAIDDPHRLARLNLKHYFDQHKRALKYWKEGWYSWKGGVYETITRDHFEGGLTKFIREEFEHCWKLEAERYEAWINSPDYRKESDKGPPKIKKVSTQLTKNVVQATKSYCSLRNSQQLHAWTDGHDEGHCVAVKNGILNLTKAITDPPPPENEILLPHTPEWFSTIKLDFPFDPIAQCPSWTQFLTDVFDNDQESIGLLQRWFGYLLTPDNSLQKILFVIGKPRSGKGTILHVMKSLFGESNIATPGLHDLAAEHTLQTFVGKTIALIADARLSEHADETIITERLLSISGGDPQHISRKYKDHLTGYNLPVRFTLFSNLLPRIKDASGAFLSRCMFLRMPSSHLGREDLGLRDRLLSELPGILNWAILGRHFLDRDGRLTQPNAASILVDDMREIINPVADFIETACERGVGLTVDTKELFKLWERWCVDNDLSHPGTIQSFCRKVKGITMLESKRMTYGSSSSRVFYGLRPRPEYQKPYE